MKRFSDQRVTPGGVLSVFFLFFLIIVFVTKTVLFPPKNIKLNQPPNVEQEIFTVEETGAGIEDESMDYLYPYGYKESTVNSTETINIDTWGSWTY